MSHLFSPINIGPHRLRNRIVHSSLLTGLASPGGFVSEELQAYYETYARNSVGLIITEPISVVPLDLTNVLALYDDSFISGMYDLCRTVQTHGTAIAALLSHRPLPPAQLQTEPLAPIQEAFLGAIWRARAAGFNAVLLHGADGALLHQLTSPHANHRNDKYGQGAAGRTQFPLEIVEAARQWLGSDIILGYRLSADDLLPDGLSLQDSRVFAKRLVSASILLLDISAGFPTDEQHIARFPGWQVPLVEAIRRIAEVPVIAHGGLDDPQLAESVLAEGSADLVAIGRALDDDVAWPRKAAALLGVSFEEL